VSGNRIHEKFVSFHIFSLAKISFQRSCVSGKFSVQYRSASSRKTAPESARSSRYFGVAKAPTKTIKGCEVRLCETETIELGRRRGV
jgi:hypothetical protein